MFDFALFLVIVTGVSGLIWALDIVWWRKQRLIKQGEQAKQPVIVEYAESFFPVLLLVLVLRSFLFEPFRIPSGSMLPTLLVGDFIVVSKFSYGLRLPVLNTKVLDIDEPSRGDIMVFKYPENPKINYIKRVVGLPGDEVSYRNKTLYINGEPAELEYKGMYSYLSGSGFPVSVQNYDEVLTKELEHDILINNSRPATDGSWIVPANSYFVMGDNRDDSRDSRFWEYVPEENLVGKAVAIWLHWDIGGSGFKFSRIGTMLK